jgi:DNA repair exonuclease SbcCD ATPase subunit
MATAADMTPKEGDDSENARLLNRMLTYLRKLEMKLDDKADRVYVDNEIDELRAEL